MGFVLMLHSIVRWAVIIVAIIAIVKLALSWFGQFANEKMDRGLLAAFSGLMDLQALLGLVFLLWSGLTTNIGFPMYRIEHAVTMIIAVVIAHLPRLWRNAPAPLRARNSLIAIVLSLLLVFAGIASLTRGASPS